MYTQCPKCLTYFQVSAEHLKIAQGKVRCGQCRTVFSALGNLSELPPSYNENSSTQVPKPDIKQENKKSHVRKSAKKVSNTTEKTQNSNVEKQSLGNAIDAINALNRSSTGLPSLEEGRDAIMDKLKTTDHTVVMEPSTESKPSKAKSNSKTTTKRKAKEKAKPAKSKKTQTKESKPSKPAKKQRSRRDIAIPTDDTTNIDLDEALLAIDELDADDLPSEDEIDIDQISEVVGEIYQDAGFDEDNYESLEDMEANFQQVDDESTVIMKETPSSSVTEPIAPAIPKTKNKKKSPFKRAVSTKTKALSVPTLSLDSDLIADIPKHLLDDLHDEEDTQPISMTSYMWSAASVILMLVFLGQTIYFKHDQLAQYDSLRSFIGSFCETFSCEIALKKDTRQLELLGQDIRTHPKTPGALLVSTTIINNASFIQAYPGLQITFSDLNGQQVATRRFLPTEYLKDILSIDTGMQSDTPVLIELEVLDPGKKAVNFEFEFFSVS